MKPRTHKRLLKAWPALCGLATFGIFAAVSFVMPSGSLALPAVAGGLAWVASYAMLHAESGDVVVGVVNKDEDEWAWMDDPEYSHMAGNIFYHSHFDDD